MILYNYMTETDQIVLLEQTPELTQLQKYDTIVDKLLEKIGGKEYCLRQLLPESDHRSFIVEYRNNNRKNIMKFLQERFYKELVGDKEALFDENNFVDIDVNSAIWNRHIMKMYFYDTENNKFFEYYVKTGEVENVSMFEDDEVKTYPKSFFSKIRNGNSLWEQYKQILDKNQQEKYVEKLHKEREFFVENMKTCRFVDNEEIDALTFVKAPEQYRDGKVRYIANNVFYYQIFGISGYVTFESGTDLLLNSGFSKLFHDKIVKKVREEQ